MSETITTIPQALFHAVEHHAETPALIDGARHLSYRQLLQRSLEAASVFREAGIGKHDRVAIWMPNSIEWVEAALGALILGAVLVPLNTRFKGPEAAYILKRSRAGALVAADSFLGTDYLSLLHDTELPDLSFRIAAGIGSDENSPWHKARTAAPSFTLQAALASMPAGDDLAEIMFTSGTTGFPKGAMLCHAQIIRAYTYYADRADIRRGDRYLIIAPMFHSFGFKAGVLAAILRGATIYPVQIFDVDRTLGMIEREGITTMGGPPTIFSSLLDLNRKMQRNMSSLRSVVTGASMVSPSMIRSLQNDVGVATVVNAYGLTEACALVTTTGPADSVEQIAGTSGRVIDGVEMRCTDSSGDPVSPGEPGEIEVRGYNIMRGYFEDAEETERTIRPEGWLRTGDIGIIDEEGYLRVTDRKKDMFIVGGFNCYPAEIEKIIISHPDILEAAVVGIPDERLGEVGKAFIVLRLGASLQAAALIEWCRENMANYKVPRQIEIVDKLPRNAMGKLQKFLLRQN